MSQQAVFGCAEERVKRRCGAHRRSTDMLLNPGQMCVGEDAVGARCQHRSMFGVRGGRARHCRQHRQPEEIDLVHKRCEMSGCGKQASFGDATDRVPRHCSQHKLSDHVIVRGDGSSRKRKRMALTARRRSGKRPRPATVLGTQGGDSSMRPLKTLGEEEADAAVVQIYASRPQGAKYKCLDYRKCSARFGVSPKTVRDIWHRITWVSNTRPYWTETEVREYARSWQERARPSQGMKAMKVRGARSARVESKDITCRSPRVQMEEPRQGESWFFSMPHLGSVETGAATECARKHAAVSCDGAMDVSAGMSGFCQELPTPLGGTPLGREREREREKLGGFEWSLPSLQPLVPRVFPSFAVGVGGQKVAVLGELPPASSLSV
jgi:hypothetical protein